MVSKQGGMHYVNAIKGAGVGFVVLTALATWVPIPTLPIRLDSILTISTFLFAILAGFYTSRLGNRYDSIRQLVAVEDATILSFYQTAKIFGPVFVKKVRSAIDHYYIASYDHTLSDYAYKQSAPYYFKLWDVITALPDKEPSSAYEALITQLTEIEKSRNTSAATAKERLGWGEWAILLILAGIILSSLFLMREPVLYSWIVTILFGTALILVMLIIRDLQNLMFGGSSLLEESGQEVLEFMGLPRYYHEHFLKLGISVVPLSVKTYRMGTHKRGASTFKIKTVKR